MTARCVRTCGLRLRSGPGESYEKLLTVPDGTVLPCISLRGTAG